MSSKKHWTSLSHQHNSLGLFPPLGLPPLFCGGWRRRRQENLGVLRSNLDDFLSKIDDFEVQILKIFSPAAGFPWNVHFWCPKSKILSQNTSKWTSDFGTARFIPPLFCGGLGLVNNKGGINPRDCVDASCPCHTAPPGARRCTPWSLTNLIRQGRGGSPFFGFC